MKRFIWASMLSMVVSLCCNAAPEGWLNDVSKAKSFSRNRNLPIIVLFSGGSWSESSMEFQSKLNHSPEVAELIRRNCVPLYVELSPASRWTRDYREQLQAEFPFIQVSAGIPLPSIYFVDGNFRNLNVREPHFSMGGFQRSIKQAQAALDARLAVPAEVKAPAERVTQDKKIPAPKTEKRNKFKKMSDAGEAEKETQTDNRTKGSYTAAAQQKEARRQRKLPRNYRGEPPPGWFTDPRKAREFAAARRLPIVILFSGTDWCGPCKKLHATVLKTGKVQKMMVSECVGLYVNVQSGNWQATKKEYPFWRAQGVPSMVITDSKFSPLADVSGSSLWEYGSLRQAIRNAANQVK